MMGILASIFGKKEMEKNHLGLAIMQKDKVWSYDESASRFQEGDFFTFSYESGHNFYSLGLAMISGVCKVQEGDEVRRDFALDILYPGCYGRFGSNSRIASTINKIEMTDELVREVAALQGLPVHKRVYCPTFTKSSCLYCGVESFSGVKDDNGDTLPGIVLNIFVEEGPKYGSYLESISSVRIGWMRKPVVK